MWNKNKLQTCLSPRQKEILALKASGLTFKGMAQELGISPSRTARLFYWARVVQKRGAMEPCPGCPGCWPAHLRIRANLPHRQEENI